MNTNTQTKAYIINNDELIAEIMTDLKNGTDVRISEQTSYDALRQCYTLVNADDAKISRAKKWQKIAAQSILASAKQLDATNFALLN